MTNKIVGIPLVAHRSSWFNFIVFSILTSSLFALYINGSATSCLLALYQNMILPFLGTKFLLPYQSPIIRNIKLGVALGGLIGAIGATSHLAFLAIGFYVLGGRETILGDNNTPVPSITSETVIMEISLSIISWIILVGISIVSGIVGGALNKNQENPDFPGDQ